MELYLAGGWRWTYPVFTTVFTAIPLLYTIAESPLQSLLGRLLESLPESFFDSLLGSFLEKASYCQE
jgi:hypothetical protein